MSYSSRFSESSRFGYSTFFKSPQRSGKFTEVGYTGFGVCFGKANGVPWGAVESREGIMALLDLIDACESVAKG